MRLSAVSICRTGGLAAFGLLLLSACTVVVDDGPDGPRPGPRPPRPEPQYCTRDYQPVCAERGRDRRTFANGCLADEAGFEVIRRGECRRDRDPDPIDEPRFCTREYRPVCGQRGPRIQTFSNSCEADVAGFRVVDRGPC